MENPNDIKESLLPQSLEPSREHHRKAVFKRRKFCRTRSAPLTVGTLGALKVRYGDLSPESVLAKLLASAFVFSGMALVGLILSKGADYLVEKQDMLLGGALYAHKKLGPSDFMKEIETKKVGYKCLLVFIVLLVLIVVGTTFIALVEKLDFLDAFYCVCATITTLGYGDRSFLTEGGRVFAALWILVSAICLAQFLLYIAEVYTERRQNTLVHWVLTRRVTSTDLEAADINNDGHVEAAEFVLYKLKELGKITQEDISLVMEEFEELDFEEMLISQDPYLYLT